MKLVLISFLAGIVSITSPCVFPLVPVILAGGAGSRLRPVIIVMGMSITFTVMGVLTSIFREAMGSIAGELRIFGIILIILMGAVLVSERLNSYFVMYSTMLLNKLRVPGFTSKQREGYLGALLLGLSLGIVWIPCVGPVLGPVLMLVTSDVVTGGASLFAYSIGLGIPMLAVAYLGKFFTSRVASVSKYNVYAKKIAGWVLIIAGIAFLFNLDRILQSMLAPYMPELESKLAEYLS